MANMANSRRCLNGSGVRRKNMDSCEIWLTIFILAVAFNFANAWDSTDLELFDLVEEVQQNFYEVLGVDQTASQSDVRRAYRRLTLLHHPDKTDEEGAEERFRQLVAVSEVLRDEDKRRRYDEILEKGLPDWRQPVYYYRRVRKMGLLELCVLLSGIFTVGHYLVLWSIYFERQLELEALIKPKKERKSKKANKQPSNQPSESTNQVPLDDPNFIKKPTLSDILPWKLACLVIATFKSLPEIYQNVVENWKERRKAKLEASNNETEEDSTVRIKERSEPRERQRLDPATYDYDRTASASVAMNTRDDLAMSSGGGDSVQEDTKMEQQLVNVEWSASEVSSLVKAMTKFPGGTTDRWVKIAEEIKKPIDTVTKKAKQLKSQKYATNIDAASQGITGGIQQAVTSKKSGRVLTDDVITQSSYEAAWESSESYEYSGGSENRRHKFSKPVKSTDRTLLIAQQSNTCDNDNNGTGAAINGTVDNKTIQNREVDELVHSGVESCAWTQRQQKILEKAMQVFPRGSEGRWDQIADTVPGKTKEECIARYKELVEVVKRRKKTADQT